ncbi:hypothetical protein ACX0G9_16405 [Flavitalea flava]
MKKPIPFEEFVRHFTDQVSRADRDFKLLQNYYHNKSDLYNLTPDGLGISEISIRLSLKRYRPCFLVRLFRKTPPEDLLKITPPGEGEFEVTISIKRENAYQQLDAQVQGDEDLSGKFVV